MRDGASTPNGLTVAPPTRTYEERVGSVCLSRGRRGAPERARASPEARLGELDRDIKFVFFLVVDWLDEHDPIIERTVGRA
ncbi:hypothetical protein NL676_037126 [Syzygium grande]|nr:hypothetical protein NL676_037126 [Syzygium grande]